MLKGPLPILLIYVTFLASAQQYLPKEPGYLPINTLYAKDMVS